MYMRACMCVCVCVCVFVCVCYWCYVDKRFEFKPGKDLEKLVLHTKEHPNSDTVNINMPCVLLAYLGKSMSGL